MRITQGTFSYLPDLTDDEIRAQVQYSIDQGWAVAVEFTDDPHPRNVLWEMWGLPMFGIADAAAAMHEVTQCRAAYPGHYIRVSACDASLGRQTTALSFIVNRPASEPAGASRLTSNPAWCSAAGIRIGASHSDSQVRSRAGMLTMPGNRKKGMRRSYFSS